MTVMPRTSGITLARLVFGKGVAAIVRGTAYSRQAEDRSVGVGADSSGLRCADKEVAVAESTPFTIGVVARCADGVCGRVTQVVLNPIENEVTHLIVEPEHRQGRGRLVPVEWVRSSGDEVDLLCTGTEFDRLEIAEQVRFLPGSEGFFGYDAEQALLWPYFGGNTTLPATVDTLPVGEVAVQRDDEVRATDGRIGHVEGFVVDSRNHHATHLLLKEGHLFGRKEVAIPIGDVTSVGDGCIRLSISQQAVDGLPAVDFRRPGK